MKKLSIDEYILLNYKEKTNQEMADELGCNKSTISNHRKKLGISWSDLNNKLQEKIPYICSQYGKKTRKEIAKEVGCSVAYIQKVWAANKIERIDTTYYYNKNYFEKIDSPDKAYFLGFIAADGNIYRREGHQGMLSISVNEKDIEILEYFKKQLNTTKPIQISLDKRQEKTKMATIQITGDKIVNDLLSLGIGVRKTFDIDINNLVKKIPSSYISSFYLGYFDGDGSIFLPEGEISKSSVNISGPIKSLEAMKENLLVYHIEAEVYKDKRNYSQPFGSLEFPNTTKKYCFLKFIYSSKVKSLARKRERALELCSRIENNITSRSENTKAIEYYNLWF